MDVDLVVLFVILYPWLFVGFVDAGDGDAVGAST